VNTDPSADLSELVAGIDGPVGGRYVVEHLLGVGGMGVVVAARNPALDQEVAIKFMRAEVAADATLSARFLREAKVAAKAKSPHFVRVFDFGRLDSGVPYLVMERLVGHDLGAELALRGPLAVEVAVDYILQASVGLAELHALGIVHRDLKPANLFIAEAAGTRVLKVLDLGLSTERPGDHAELTKTGHTLGTPHYMSPEQIKQMKGVDARSDLWSLAVILQELLTRAVPFGNESSSSGEIFGLVLHTEPVPPRAWRSDLPVALEQVVLRGLRRDPEERYANVAEFAEALRPFAAVTSLARIADARAAFSPVGRADSLDSSDRSAHGMYRRPSPIDAAAEAHLHAASSDATRSLDGAAPHLGSGGDRDVGVNPSGSGALVGDAMRPSPSSSTSGVPRAGRWLRVSAFTAFVACVAVGAVLYRHGTSPTRTARTDGAYAPPRPDDVSSMASVTPTSAPVETPVTPASMSSRASAPDASGPPTSSSSRGHSPPRARPSQGVGQRSGEAARPGPSATSVLDGLDRK
jgi:serine/threonine-protein kinase